MCFSQNCIFYNNIWKFPFNLNYSYLIITSIFHWCLDTRLYKNTFYIPYILLEYFYGSKFKISGSSLILNTDFLNRWISSIVDLSVKYKLAWLASRILPFWFTIWFSIFFVWAVHFPDTFPSNSQLSFFPRICHWLNQDLFCFITSKAKFFHWLTFSLFYG